MCQAGRVRMRQGWEAAAPEAAGLLIEAIREPKAPDELVAGQPGKQRWQRIPLILQLRAVKP